MNHNITRTRLNNIEQGAKLFKTAWLSGKATEFSAAFSDAAAPME